ncbi:hypothetical protein RN001_006842 [Aquatica leii]|uniref:O-phosphoseryl-tRNA(Sec) selenium transferase n=1 Tax=Aquatica leii TaxID=1421715 RepID=A0AAN7PEI5_9COLE|nr:hypothetical protein RN001_006842 [Aquatica leii]
MNKDSWDFFEKLVPANYVKQAAQATSAKENLIRQLIQHKTIPDIGWNDITIETFLYQLSSMDSNNFNSNYGVGERESRIASGLVARRHYYFGHGIGRSGDLNEAQPKAAGSSLMYSLTNCMFKDLMKLMGIRSSIECLVVPVATGMALVLCMLSFRSLRPKAKYVIWLRIDQKSCFKSILTAGFEPIIINPVVYGDKLSSGIQDVVRAIEDHGSDAIACVISTTSCFAPRIPDDIDDIGAVCKKYDIPHLVNNAYGLQSKRVMKKIQNAYIRGRIDAFVQSTDKNIMVPVGGTVIASFDPNILTKISKTYPGRASSTPIVDSFITLLHLGKNGYRELVDDREAMFDYLKEGLSVVANKFGERLLNTSENDISVAMSLSTIPKNDLTKVGSMLFLRNISGARVITTYETKTISGYEFPRWGSHNFFKTPYITAAAGIGMTKKDVDAYVAKLTKVLSQVQKGEDNVVEGFHADSEVEVNK